MTEALPNRLRELREAQGLKPEHLALEFGVTTKTVERWERGENEMPFRALAKRFGVSISFLLRDDEPVAA